MCAFCPWPGLASTGLWKPSKVIEAAGGMSQSKSTMSGNGGVESVMESSPASSCVSSDAEEVVASPMVVAGCPQCLMYVMLSKEEEKQLKCPKCKSPVLLHFHKCDGINKG
ncbi:hypothetical protein EJB05_10357 [Eragrostis curvula]|uniref:GIR1-like zinc ribbon domain-containing protein n=1 Tax=Eragrostis curvula TaxID=38414 RepID=A0A5J9W7C4_9POAL|nr:hypothetical protein EJB05_10357 [Eragrostis curvula]